MYIIKILYLYLIKFKKPLLSYFLSKNKKPIEVEFQLAFVVKFDSRLSFTYLHSITYLLLLSIDSKRRFYTYNVTYISLFNKK